MSKKDTVEREMPVCYVCNELVLEPNDDHPWFVDNKVYFIWPLHNWCADKMNTGQKRE